MRVQTGFLDGVTVHVDTLTGCIPLIFILYTFSERSNKYQKYSDNLSYLDRLKLWVINARGEDMTQAFLKEYAIG